MDEISNVKIMLWSIGFAILAHLCPWIILELYYIFGASSDSYILGFIILSDILLIIMYFLILRNIKNKGYVYRVHKYLIIFVIAFLIEINVVTLIYMAGIILISGIFILGVGKIFTVPIIYIISNMVISHYTVKYKNGIISPGGIKRKSDDVLTVLLYVLMFIITICLAILYFPRQM